MKHGDGSIVLRQVELGLKMEEIMGSPKIFNRLIISLSITESRRCWSLEAIA